MGECGIQGAAKVDAATSAQDKQTVRLHANPERAVLSDEAECTINAMLRRLFQVEAVGSLTCSVT